jgi:chitodextrinase
MRKFLRITSSILCFLLLLQIIFCEMGYAKTEILKELTRTNQIENPKRIASLRSLSIADNEQSEAMSVTTAPAIDLDNSSNNNSSEQVLKVQMYNSNKNPASNSINPRYKIYNTGTTPINFVDLNIRYYYTIDQEKEQNFWCDWSSAETSYITGAFVSLPENQKGADTYLEIGFKPEAGSLQPGSSVEIQCRFAKSDWTDYDQSDDYSFNSSDNGYAEWGKTTVYSSGNLIWGMEPDEATSSDNVPPITPGNLKSYSISSSEVSLSWSPSTDDSGISGYILYRDGVEIARIRNGLTAYTDTGLTGDATYSYEVAAYDYTNNISEKSTPVIVKTGKNITKALKVQMYNSDKNASGNTIFSRYMIYNTGNVDLNVSDIKIRYYYTINGEKAQNFWCDWSTIGSSNVIGTLNKMAKKEKGADTYLEISFKNDAGVLKPGASMELHCRIGKSDWTSYDQTDDYSFNSTDSTYANWTKVTAYNEGILLWGLEPGTEAPADKESPTVPRNLTSYSIAANEISLSWEPSTDNIGVSGYIVYRNGMEIARVNEGTSYIDKDLQFGTTYTYEVAAFDYSNNISLKSKAVSAKTGENINSSIKLQLNNANKALDNNTIFPWYKIYNTGNVPVNLKDVKVRYYYTVNGEKPQNFWCDWSSAGSSNVIGTFIRMPAVVEGVDYCLEISFKSGAGILQPGQSAEIQCRIAKNDWSNYNQADDYSFSNNSGYMDWNKVTGYIDGNLVWGLEPIAPVSNFTAVPAAKEIVLSWDAVPSAAAYELEVDGVILDDITDNTYTHKELIPGTRHTYRIRAKNQIMYGPWSDCIAYITLLDKPANITTDVNASEIKLYWDAVDGAISYDVEINGEITNNGLSNQYEMNQLGSGTMHTVRIRAKGRDIDGEWSQLMQIWTLPDTPSNIKTTQTSNSISLAWDQVTGAAGYEVEVYGSPADNGNSTSFALSGLESNTQRTFRVRSKNPSGVSAWSSVIAVSTLPGGLFNIQIQPTDSTLEVTWDKQAGAVSYEIEIDGTIVQETTESIFIHSGLESNTEHSYRVRAKNADGYTQWSPVAKGTTLPCIPANFKAASVESTRIALVWDGVSGATGYDIEVDGVLIGNNNETSFTHSGLMPNSQHTYKVRARSGDIAGEWTGEIIRTTLLPAPKNLKATASENKSVLSWDMVVGAEYYEVEINGKPVKAGSNTEYIQDGLTAGLVYTYKVRAVNENGAGEWSDKVTKTTLLGKPQNITTTSSSISINLNWDGVDGALAYDVMVDGSIVDNADQKVFGHTGLKPNTMHTYRVRARSEEGPGEWSNTVAAYTLVGIPANIKTFAKSTEISVTWDEVDGADSYEIIADGKVINNKAETVYTHINLTPNTVHTYSVRAKNSNGEGEWSNIIVQLTGPAVPANFKAIPEINRISLSWDKSDGAVSYELEADGEVVENITELKHTHEGLEPNTRHEYRIRAKNKDGVSSEWSEILGVNTTDEIIIDVDKENYFNFVIAVPKKVGVDSYHITVNYNPDEVEVVDLFATTQKLEMEAGKIEGNNNISIKEVSAGKIVYQVDKLDKALIAIIKFISKTNEESKMSYTVE